MASKKTPSQFITFEHAEYGTLRVTCQHSKIYFHWGDLCKMFGNDVSDQVRKRAERCIFDWSAITSWTREAGWGITLVDRVIAYPLFELMPDAFHQWIADSGMVDPNTYRRDAYA